MLVESKGVKLGTVTLIVSKTGVGKTSIKEKENAI